MEITYSKYGDVYLPDLIIEDEASIIGKYGRMRKSYLKDHRPVM
ncbi:MAG: TnpV protein [Oscillospiraceae bacterium]|nr:TnpV protein [Oscillospiraceae bacterium]